VEGTLPEYGFAKLLSIRGRGLKNVLLAQADVFSLPLQDRSTDIVLSVNLLDRVSDPQSALREARRILRPGGALLLTTPLNWTKPKLWHDYPDAKTLLRLVTSCGFTMKAWFDQLLYREVIDARGSVEEFSTLILSARAL
jgi:ubiquinone/menaquinone biosynthesis C-methylase UbiE